MSKSVLIRLVFHANGRSLAEAVEAIQKRLKEALSPLVVTLSKELAHDQDVVLHTGMYQLFFSVTTYNDEDLVFTFLDTWMPKDPERIQTILKEPVLAQFVHDSLFRCPLISTHCWEPLSEMSFGCFLGLGVFYQAGVIDLKKTENLTALFEHDQSRLTIFMIANGMDSVGRMITFRYKIYLPYKCIYSLTVDCRNDVAYFYFRIKQPPSLYRSSNLSSLISHYEATFEWVCVERTLVGASSVIRLTLPIDDNNNHLKIWDIICRLRQRGHLLINMGQVRLSPEIEDVADPVSDLNWTFNCQYAWYALKSRGLVITKQADERFFQAMDAAFAKNPVTLERTLEFLLTVVDRCRDIILPYAFEKYLNDYSSSAEWSVPITEADGDFVRIRKLIITPTRRLFTVPEMMMSNRVIRKFGVENALRVLFRNEAGFRVPAYLMTPSVLNDIVRKPLMEGLWIGRRHYEFLGWSNSQLRDGGCYFYTGKEGEPTVADIRAWMGDFTGIRNVAKLMARMGQCFTQAQSVVEIPFRPGSHEVPVSEDVECKMNKETKFCFSDGIGQISPDLAKVVAERLGISPVPSAFQIRFAGFKGMVVVNPSIGKDKVMVLRKSMQKFTTENSNALEVVKTSQPVAVNLNRPLILILDQIAVSEEYSVKVRIRSRITELLNLQLYRMADSLLYESCAVAQLSQSVPYKFNFSSLAKAGVSLTTEVFFRNVMLSIYCCKVKEQLHKLKIDLPPNLGRTLFGVLDEVGVLNQDEVFIQISSDIGSPGQNLQIIEGEVMVTKSPCIVPGDVRILNAVNRRSVFSHLHDVIVFPKTGFRPLTDQMAGSDLDGDEYSVFWDDQLLFHKVYEPMSFDKVEVPQFEGQLTVKDMVDFFIKYLTSDSIGLIATAHLIASDRLGIFSEIPMRIAQKHAMAVDFSKTGVVPDNLTDDERPMKNPDYMDDGRKLVYRSRWLPGPMTRRVRAVSDVIDISNVRFPKEGLDKRLLVHGWDAFERGARDQYERYKEYIFPLMSEYGVESEFQLFSGHFVLLKNRLARGERDDFSYYTTERVIQYRLRYIIRNFRKRFFKEFAIDEANATPVDFQKNAAVLAKASAWYVVAYSDKERQQSCPAYSFPWLISDAMVAILQRNESAQADASPLMSNLEKLIDSVSMLDEKTNQLICSWIDEGQLPEGCTEGAKQVLYIFLQWCRRSGVIDSSWSFSDLALLAEIFANFLKSLDDKSYDEKAFEVLPASGTDQFASHMMSRSELLMQLLKYVGSRLSQFDPDDLSQDSNVLLVDAAFKSYHRIALTGKFSSLYLEMYDSIAWDVKETEAFLFLPPYPFAAGLEMQYMKEKLKEWSGVTELVWRAHATIKGRQRGWKVVTAKGTLEARCRLYELLTMKNLERALNNGFSPLSTLPTKTSHLIS